MYKPHKFAKSLHPIALRIATSIITNIAMRFGILPGIGIDLRYK